jgi:DUF1680 family protein
MDEKEKTRSLKGTIAPPLRRVQIDGGFWGRLMDVNRRVTLPIEYEQCRATGRIDAFDLTWKPGDPNPPHIFWDSDVAKWIEAAAYSLASHPDADLERLVDGVIDRIARSQHPDGYLNTHYTAVEPEKRWSNLRDCHELYCAGHLIEAAVAHFEATGKRTFLDVVCRYANHIGRVFGTGEGQKRGYPGHEEIELALVKLWRVTGEKRYLDLAKYFIDERGREPHYFDLEARERGEDPATYWAKTYAYCQAHVPVREQREATGHAVRAMYLYCGMADVAAATGDRTLLAACKRLWKNLVRKQMHITAGLGPVQANEGFTCDYDLPTEGAYLETCAAIGLVFWAHRMLAIDLDGEYADVMERALYNGTISGVSSDGKTFFYGNPLAAQPGFDGNGRFVGKEYHYRRSEWFGCACCPPNIARMIAQFPAFVYSARAKELAVHLYAESAGEVAVAGQKVHIAQETEYPWGETVVLTVTPEKAATWTLALRVPGWCRGVKLRVNGKAVALAPITKKGYARLKREWRAGDRVALTLPMPVERIEAHPAVRQDGGRVALQRGPVVYCLEEADNGKNLTDLLLPADPGFTVEPGRSGILAGVPLIRARAARRDASEWQGALYQRQGASPKVPSSITAIPYFLWANRAPGEMLVWIRQAEPVKSGARGIAQC